MVGARSVEQGEKEQKTIIAVRVTVHILRYFGNRSKIAVLYVPHNKKGG
jgi:hypothetical protein